MEGEPTESQVTRANAMLKSMPKAKANPTTSTASSSSGSGAAGYVGKQDVLQAMRTARESDARARGSLVNGFVQGDDFSVPGCESKSAPFSPTKSPDRKQQRNNYATRKRCGCAAQSVCIQCDPDFFAKIKLFEGPAPSEPAPPVSSAAAVISLLDNSQPVPTSATNEGADPRVDPNDRDFWNPGGGPQDFPATQDYREAPVPESPRIAGGYSCP